ncbi:AsmA family protein [Marinicauda algicola]|uniref:AsmA family protein n=1 Tax=Marinicauda algicola TaxID=2029849 RepID=A0A4S2H226_9PROT|nr:AsmA family protein [Marinicauda algicola]TGY89640.1 AsmA family protein [Marinicauda algicola]
MRRILLVLAFLLATGLAAALIAPSLIPADAYRDRIEQAASDALGREVSISGDISLALLPKVQARAGDVTIANAEGFGEEPFAQMDALRLTLQLLPLVRREFVIEEFILVDPVIRLEQRAGRNNWSFGTGDTAPATSAGEGFRRPGALPIEASFGDVRIENGTLIYAGDGDARRFEAVDLAIGLPGVDAPVSLEGGFTLEGRAMDFSASLGSLRGFFEGARTPAALSLTGPIGEVGFDGHILESRELEYEGAADLDLVLPELAAVFGASLPPGEGFRRFAATGRLAGAPGRISLSESDLAFDDITASGSLDIDYAGARPRLDGRVDIPELNLNPYLPEPAGTGPGADAGWSEEPIDLSALRLVDARLRGSVGRLLVREIEFSDAELDAALDNGRLSADLTQFLLYGGRGNARVVANARTAVPSYAFTGRLEALEALPFLTAAAGFERLRGTGTLGLDLTGSGSSIAAIMESLSGTGDFDFTDGAIVGVNLAQVIRGVLNAVETRSLPDAFGDRQETDFSALRGTISMADGVARNPDLTMLSPLLRAAGEGEVDLGARRLDYRFTPRAVASLSGQGGEADLQGIGVPILISGDFADPQITLDFATIARNLVQARAQGQLGDLGQLLDLERMREQGAGGLLDILTGAAGTQPAEETETQPGETPADDQERAGDLLRGILGEAIRRSQEDTTQETQDEPAAEDGESEGSSGGG